MKRIAIFAFCLFALGCEAKNGQTSGTFYGSVGSYQYGGMTYLIFQSGTSSGGVAVVNYTLDSITFKKERNVNP